jgi:hypothetical protein
MLMHKLPVVICCLVWMLLCKCTPTVSGVETTNGTATVTTTSTTIEGTAPPLSQVYMCDTGYIPYLDSGIGYITSTDLDGNFQFTRKAGSYQISIISPQGAAAGININSAVPNATTIQNPLERPGSVSGTVTTTAGDTLLVYLAGTSHYRLATNGSTFLITSVPGGDYQLRIISVQGTTPLSMAILFEKSVAVQPGEKTDAGMIAVR